MRSFRHLSRAEISEIIVRHHQGETNVALATSFGVDPSTISYHIKQYERAYPEQGGIYAFIKIRVRKTCIHPSARCTLCSLMWDQIARAERDEIIALKRALDAANSKLRVCGMPVETVPYNGVNESA